MVVVRHLRRCVRHRKDRFHTHARAGFGGDNKSSTDQVESFTHTNQSESRSCFSSVLNKAYPIVRNSEIDKIAGSIQLNIDLCRVAMFRYVVQRLLHDAKETRDTSGDKLGGTPEHSQRALI